MVKKDKPPSSSCPFYISQRLNGFHGFRGFRGTEHGNLPDNHVPVLVRGGAQPKLQSSPFFLGTYKKLANFYLTILRPCPTVCSAHVAAIIITNQNEHANKLYQ